jgi:gamma-glutamylputrescine oxidase
MSMVDTTYYRATARPHPPHPSLEGIHDTRVVVIGGGFAGLNTAMSLVERGMTDVMVLERERVGFGASGRNGGFVFAGYSLGEQALLRQLGADRARALFAHTVDAVERVRARIHRHRIGCDPVEEGVIWANWFRDPQLLRSRQRLLMERFDARWRWLDGEHLRERLHTDRYSAALFEPGALHIHPLNYALGLAEIISGSGAAVYEKSPAVALQREGAHWRVRTPSGEVRAEHVVLACGGYLAGLQRAVDRSVLPIATYVMVTEPLGDRLREAIDTRAAVYDTRFAFDYYRPLPDSRLLWGGRISVRDRSPAAVQRLLRRDLGRVYPQLADARVEHAWSGLMSYARHQMPQIGGAEGLWWAQAFGGHGLAPTTVAGELLAAALAEGDDGWREFADFGLVSAWRPAGYVAAQLSYWWAQARDWGRELLEG